MAEPLNLQGLTPPHRLCLETSFTSLQSPTVNIINNDSSKASSATGSVYNTSSTATRATARLQSPSRLDSIISYDFASLLDEQLNIAGGSRTITPSAASDRLVNQPLGVYNFSNPSNGVCYRAKKSVGFESNRHAMRIEPYMRYSGEPKVSYIAEKDSCKVDLIHDDWFGLAPLASPESLSELSSISSRTSLCHVNEKCGTNIVTVASITMDAMIQSPKCSTETLPTTDYAMSTPKVLRRTPKIPGNLSTCADDVKNVVKYQKMNQNFRFLGRRPPPGSLSGSSRESSFESATSAESAHMTTVRTALPIIRSPLKYVPSLDRSDSPLKIRKPDCCGQSDEFCLNVKEGFYSAENIIENKSSEPSFVTKSDSNILEGTSSRCARLCDKSIKDLPQKYENGSAKVINKTINIPDNNSVSTSSEIFLSTKSSMQSYESFDTKRSPVNRKGLLMKERNVYGSSLSSEGSPIHCIKKSNEGTRLLEDSETEKADSIQIGDDGKRKKCLIQKKRCKSMCHDKNAFTHKNESLPLLSNIGVSMTHSPPSSYVKRKKYVYPISSVMNKGESSV